MLQDIIFSFDAALITYDGDEGPIDLGTYLNVDDTFRFPLFVVVQVYCNDPTTLLPWYMAYNLAMR